MKTKFAVEHGFIKYFRNFLEQNSEIPHPYIQQAYNDVVSMVNETPVNPNSWASSIPTTNGVDFISFVTEFDSAMASVLGLPEDCVVCSFKRGISGIPHLKVEIYLKHPGGNSLNVDLQISAPMLSVVGIDTEAHCYALKRAMDDRPSTVEFLNDLRSYIEERKSPCW